MEISIVLLEPQEEGNIGSVARAMKNFGFSDLVLVNPVEIGATARRFSAHGRDVLLSARTVDDLSHITNEFEVIVGTTGKLGGAVNPRRVPVDPTQLSEQLDSNRDVLGKVALLFGREGIGLTNEEIKKCDYLVSIPADRRYPILNLSQAVVIILYELTKKRNRKIGWNRGRLASAKEKEILHMYLKKLTDSCYPDEARQRSAYEIASRVLGKAMLTGSDVKSLTGLFRSSWERIERIKDI